MGAKYFTQEKYNDNNNNNNKEKKRDYLTIIPRTRVGYEMVNSKRGP